MSTSKVRQGRPAPFAPIPWELQDQAASEDYPDIDAYAIAVFAALKRYADFGKPTGAEVSDRTVAEKAGCGVTTVKKRRSALQKAGWIDWRSGSGEGEVNEYTIHATLPDTEGGSRETARGSSSDDEGGSRETTTTENHRPKASTENSSGLRPSPGEAGQGDQDPDDQTPDQREPSDWLEKTPEQDGFADSHFVTGVREVLWTSPDVPPAAPPDWSLSADLLELKRRAEGTSNRKAAEFVVGLGELRDRGELSGIDPGEPMTMAYAKRLAERKGRSLWSEAREAAHALLRRERDGDRDPRVEAALSEAMGVEVSDEAA